MGSSIEEFLEQCKQSGDAAYSAFRSVLEKLEDPNPRTEARIFLSRLQKRFDSPESCDQCFQTFHFRIHDIFLEQYEGYKGRKKLTMMVIPSIFIPEDWSFTFYEGLNWHPDSIFKDKTVYGLDINPRAVKISWINLYLNALDENGQLIYDEEKKTLLDRVEFYESDLLGYCRDHGIMLEQIVGCIPQILNSNPDAMSKMITENASEEFLYSLSNYCALQGFVEDQFGLGLIARAVEEGIAVIEPMGIMIFNMGGRPAQGVCKRLFERRGFHVNKLWQTKIIQVADTDISALVEIEKNSPHRFEFFMGLTGDKTVCARTAWAYGKAGGRISHALSVKKIFEFLKNGIQEISNSLDLSFEDDSIADEKIPYLAYLVSILKESPFLPYEPTAGSRRFRNLISGFMKTYHHIPLNSNNVIVYPSRSVAIENALRLFSPQLAIVDEHLTRHLPRKWLTSFQIELAATDQPSEGALTVIEAPRQSDLMMELIKRLKQRVVVTGLAHFEAVTSSAFEQLLDITREIGSRLFLDISDWFELSSLLNSNGVLKYLAGHPLPSHAAIICGLKNQVYSDLEVAFIISEDEAVFRALSETVELLEGNTSLISQNYYGCLFHELLAFQLADRHPLAERESSQEKPAEVIGFSSFAVSVLDSAELSIDEVGNSSLIHMDVDQSFLPIPSPIKAAVFENFARQNTAESESDLTTSIRQFMRSKFGFPTDSSTDFIYANNTLSLFNKLVQCCIQEDGTSCFPAGSNGNYVSAAKFVKANILTIPTQSEQGFKLTGKVLADALATVDKPWVYLSGPTINPTGLVYSNKQIEDILSVCAELGAKVVIDTSFSGLEFDYENHSDWHLEESLKKLKSCGKPSFEVSLLGGLSFELLAGGLHEFGFLVLNQHAVVDALNSVPNLSKPHSTTKYAVTKLLALKEQNAGDLADAIVEHKKIFGNRAKRLRGTLRNCGWDVLESSAGVSVVAKPSSYLNKSIKLNHLAKNGSIADITINPEVINDSNVREAVLSATGLCVNGGAWTGILSYCRFTIALEDSKFDRALDCILKFKNIVN
ncbi:Aminotransferase, class I/classII [Dillenia turbinata]|uniref:methionine S-methyltransferase n=1 Tax=Dillenia turbinata TaxID=194707 RepID=A0AAN8W3I0_9MAGN